jgi:hypothetical protein
LPLPVSCCRLPNEHFERPPCLASIIRLQRGDNARGRGRGRNDESQRQETGWERGGRRDVLRGVRGDEVVGGSWRRRGSALLLGALHTLLCRANGRETHVHVGPTSQLTYFPFFC